MINGITVGLGILSYRAHDTLLHTLETYQKEKLCSVFDDCVIYFNDFSEQDREIANSYGYKAAGGPNIGFKAQEQLARQINSDYIVLTQNDCPLVENLFEVQKQLVEALRLLEDGVIDIMRLRHRWCVGEGFCDVEKYASFYNVVKIDENFQPQEYELREGVLENSWIKSVKKIVRPDKARRMIGRSVYIEKEPEKIFPKYVRKEQEVFIVDSECIDYTEQSFLIKKDFFLNVLCNFINQNPKRRTLHGFQVPEYILNCRWWRKMHFKIGQGKGLFSHNRLDDSFREKHRAYNREV